MVTGIHGLEAHYNISYSGIKKLKYLSLKLFELMNCHFFNINRQSGRHLHKIKIVLK